MRINVRVKPRAGASEVEYDPQKGMYLVKVRSPPEDGKANLEATNLLSRHLGKPVRLVAGASSRKKVFEV